MTGHRPGCPCVACCLEPQEPLDVEAVELPDAWVQAHHGDPDGLSITARTWYPGQDDEVIDAEVVTGPDIPESKWAACYEGPHSGSQLAVPGEVAQWQEPRQAKVTMRPTGRECWWRLYSTPTSFMRQHQDHGVRAVYARRDNVHALVMDVEGHGRYETTALAWRVNDTDPSRTGQTELGSGKAQAPAKPGPDSIDLLVEFPPAIPGEQRFWQQMTQPGQLRHPGDNRMAWQFADWWQGGTGVRFEPGDSVKFDQDWGKPKGRGLTDEALAGEGFTPIGELAEEDS